MNTSIVASRAVWKRLSLWATISVVLCALIARAQTNSSAGAFVEPLQFTTVDTVVDPTDGSSYVVGRSGSDGKWWRQLATAECPVLEWDVNVVRSGNVYGREHDFLRQKRNAT